MPLVDLKRFLATPREREAIEGDFQLVASGVVLGPGSRRGAEKLPASGGCYFWTMDVDARRFKIYVGQTNSLKKRITDYSLDVQIHSPNDFKLRFFQEIAFDTYPGAQFNVHFMRLPDGERQNREKELIRRYDPLINRLRPPTQDDRALILKGFREYYRAAFEHRCGDV